MLYTVENSLREFNFWSGAKDTAEQLTAEQIDQIESVLEDCYPDGMTDTQINDIFWFECDWIAESLGFRDWDALTKHNRGEDEEEEWEDEEEEWEDDDETEDEEE